MKVLLYLYVKAGVNFPDGMIGLTTIPVGAAQHDMRIFRESEVNRMFRDAQVNSPFQGIMYGDKAYTAWTHARGLYKGAALEDWQNASNNAMSPVRTGAEWPFGNLNTKCKFLTFSQQQKLCESAIGHYYLVGVLIANTNTCLNGGGTSLAYFNCPPPTLAQYFNVPGLNV